MCGKLGTRPDRVNLRVLMRRAIPRLPLYATSGAVLLTAGCFHPTGIVHNAPPGDWTGPLGDARRTPYLTEHVPAEPVIAWEERFGRGYTDVPVVVGDLIFASSTAKSATVANAVTGKRIWERRLNGAVVGALLRKDERVYAVTQSREGRVEALTVERGAHAWNVKLNAPAAAGGVLVDSVIYAGNIRGEFFALSIADGHRIWRIRLPAPPATAPVPYGSDLVVVTNNDSLVLVDRATGRTSPGMKLPGSVSAPVSLHGDRLLIATQPGLVQAIHLPDLRVEWSVPVGASVLAAPGVDTSGDIYVLTRDADVWRITAQGAPARIAQLGGAATESFTLTADGMLIGKLDGSVYFLKRDGSTLWERNFAHSVRAPIAVNKGVIYVPLGDGRRVMLR
jgi:outer membrane protein assembly factor BamB